jgi:hypothetical protein
VDTVVIAYPQPRAEFWSCLKRLVGSRYRKHILYGSDQMVWPGAIPPFIEAIETAPFLTSHYSGEYIALTIRPLLQSEFLYNRAINWIRRLRWRNNPNL